MLQIGTSTGHLDLFDDLRTFLLGGAAAAGTLTLTGNAGNTETVTLGQSALGTLTLTANAGNTETVTINGRVYTFQTTLTQAAGNVLIGGSASASLDNLIAAINQGAGLGTLYGAGTLAHPNVRAEAGAGDTMVVRAILSGTGGDAITTTEGMANGSWGGGTLAGGASKVYTFQTVLTNVDGNVLIGGSASASLDNLIAAITLGSGSGTLYAAATTLHSTVTASAGAGDTMVVASKFTDVGVDAATTETLANGTFAGTALSGASPKWVQLQYDAGARRILFRAPGYTHIEQIFIGFDVYTDTPGDIFALRFWMFKAYNHTLGYDDQPGMSPIQYHLAFDTSTPYWMFVNPQRLILVSKVSTVFAASYVGKFLPYGFPSEYPQPFVVGCQRGLAVRFSDTSESTRNFFDPSPSGLKILRPDGIWYDGGNFTQSGGEQAVTTSAAHVSPYNDSATATRSRYRELRDNVDGTYTRFPLVISGTSPATDILGEFDGAHAVPGASVASEDTITVDGVQHLVVQNVFRTARQYYAAIPLQ